MKIIVFGCLLHIIIAVWNGFFGPSFGADLDAQGMHRNAVRVAENLVFDELRVGTEPYTNFLGMIYWIISDHLFIGSLLSCIFWTFSAIFLLKTTKLLDIEKKHRSYVLLIYALLPSSILYTSVTLREVYQLFFINLAIFSALLIYLKGNKRYIFALLLSLAGASFLHGALMMFSIAFLSLLIFFYSWKGKKKLPVVKIIISAPVITLMLAIGISFFSQNAYNIEDGLSGSIEKYQEGGLAIDGRTNYKTETSISGFFGLVTFIPLSLFQYLFEPMPWKISSVFVDIPILIENMLRLFLLYKAFKNLKSLTSQHCRTLIFLIISYFALETIWATGTINWGTASRHHIPALGILLIIAFFKIKPHENPSYHYRA